MDFSAKLSLPYLLPNQAQKHVTLNESLKALDALVQLSVISAEEAAPPATPTEGDRYLVAAPSTGEWAGLEGSIVSYQDGVWQTYTPQIGWLAWVEAARAIRVFDGTAWRPASEVLDVARLGINATSDATNRLAVRSPASLFDHEGGGHQLKLNKSVAAETASIVFQSQYRGHAEMGLVGDNDFVFKTSADGGVFVDALSVTSEAGHVGIGTTNPTAALHVNGEVRLKTFQAQDLPDPVAIGAGAIAFINSDPIGVTLVFCDGQNWRKLNVESQVI